MYGGRPESPLVLCSWAIDLSLRVTSTPVFPQPEIKYAEERKSGNLSPNKNSRPPSGGGNQRQDTNYKLTYQKTKSKVIPPGRQCFVDSDLNIPVREGPSDCQQIEDQMDILKEFKIFYPQYNFKTILEQYNQALKPKLPSTRRTLRHKKKKLAVRSKRQNMNSKNSSNFQDQGKNTGNTPKAQPANYITLLKQ